VLLYDTVAGQVSVFRLAHIADGARQAVPSCRCAHGTPYERTRACADADHMRHILSLLHKKE